MSTVQVWAPALALSAPAASVPAALAPAAAIPAPAFAVPAFAAPELDLSELRAYEIDSSVLSKNLKKTLADFQKVMDDLPKSASGYCIDEIELNMGFNGKGGIAFFGKLEVGVEAAVKVKIKREVSR